MVNLNRTLTDTRLFIFLEYSQKQIIFCVLLVLYFNKTKPRLNFCAATLLKLLLLVWRNRRESNPRLQVNLKGPTVPAVPKHTFSIVVKKLSLSRCSRCF